MWLTVGWRLGEELPTVSAIQFRSAHTGQCSQTSRCGLEAWDVLGRRGERERREGSDVCEKI